MTDFSASTGNISASVPTRVHGALPWVVWAVGSLTYFLAIVGRSSLAGLGTDVAVRFDAGSTILALFATLQLAVYAAMQVPAGLLLDRFGARVVVTCGMLIMAGGSVWLAFAVDAPTAIAARALTGAGDALIFPSVLRLMALWFPARRVPLLQQITAQIGHFGQVLSVAGLTVLVHATSWELAFCVLAATFVVLAILDVALVRERLPRHGAGDVRPGQGRMLLAAVREPGTRLAFWVHFVTPFGSTTFALLWGIPFATAGEGLSLPEASLLVTVLVISGAVLAPVMGLLSGAHPAGRPLIAAVSVIAQAITLGLILLWPGPAPLWLFLVWMATLSSGLAASMIAFDVARRDNPVARLSTATGVVNMGGFIAALVAVYLIGLVLDLQGADPAAYTRGELRLAMCSLFALWIVGLAGVGVETWRRRRAHRPV